MLIFLLKSTACLAIFLAFYKLMLEKESIHHFKRYFLLVALIASFIIPNLVLTEYVDVAEPTLGTYTAIENMDSAALTEQPLPQPSSFDWELFLWCVYTLGVIGFGFRFMANLFQIRKRIKKNPKFKENFMTKVLLVQALPPHTFLNYIFLNQKQYRENSIPQEVLLHEETHAKQRHSLDILFIELAQVVFWFNPLIYLFKSSIKLNHEFLADKAVIRKEQNHSHYQNTLLSYLSNDIERHQSVGIANAINYSSIKKRFTVMKTNTSKTSFVFRSFLLLPLTALLLFGFSEHRTIERQNPRKNIITIDLVDTETVQIDNNIVHFNEVAQIINQNYLSAFDADKTKVKVTAIQSVHLNTINNLSEEIRTTGIDIIEVFADEVIMEESQFKDNVAITPSTTRLNAKRMTIMGAEDDLQPTQKTVSQKDSQKTINPIEIHINKKGKLLFQSKLVALEDLKDELSKINDHLSFGQREKTIRSIINVEATTPKDIIQKVDMIFEEYGSATINIVGAKIQQQGSATREEMKEYNTLAKKYNAMDRNHMTIKKREVMRLKEIYGKMSEKQRADAEPFPDFPPPPPAPPAPGATESPMPPSPVKDLKETKPVAPSNPPAPPAPPKPIEKIKKMVAKGASFTLNGKEITGKKAIEVVQENKFIYILSMESEGANPVVKLATDPIGIEN
ncbi:M56 family metallopeptidase [Muricauda oceani]|uniref:M56 family metallopeptidase n=1 Tax=Flagellimonas oceani TaxID=2698672 RepID=A0A6G7J8A8_9FLAO|nr:M56 family metallopeptidase [Allomuricauda oceani]MBW8241957.1 M56 family metallopeptidase [Allomuricauda oceani]QII46869.1 M56 family metallopeptidase [Allomuricauda oceani]